MKRPFDKTLFHQPREFTKNRFVYAVISQRAEGLSIGINMNPDQACNFDCLYCEVKRTDANKNRRLDLHVMSKELGFLLGLVKQNRFREMPGFANVTEDLLKLKQVALSGDGEPTLCPNFYEVVCELVHLRNGGLQIPFKLVLITNATGLHLAPVEKGLKLFSGTDEIWAKLDAGAQDYMRRINKTTVPLDAVLANIVRVGRWRPIVIQSLFCSVDEKGPDDSEIEAYVQRLAELKKEGAQISLVQIYSIVREPAYRDCAHLPLARLSHIARRVREATGLKAEVY